MTTITAQECLAVLEMSLGLIELYAAGDIPQSFQCDEELPDGTVKRVVMSGDLAVEQLIQKIKSLLDRVTTEVSGADLILNERNRQIKEKGWTSEHDDSHANNELAIAAAWYAIQGNTNNAAVCFKHEDSVVIEYYPVDSFVSFELKSETDPINNLVKAGALIAAEIDRLKRKNKNI